MKFTKILGAMLAMTIGCAGLASCAGNPTIGQKPADSAAALSYVSLRINPEIELVADETGTVVAANAVNEDGEVVLADLNLAGMTVEEAGENFTDQAIALGYLDPENENATVYTDVESTDDATAEKLQKSLSDRINRYFDNHGIYGKVSAETLEAYAAQANEWQVSVGQAKMILRILDAYPEMTAEEILALSVKERVALLRDSSKDCLVSAGLRDGYKAAVAALKEEYAATFALCKEIDALRESLKDETLTEEEKAAVEAQIAEKQSAYDEQHQAYKDALKAIKDDYRTQTEALKAEQKKTCETRKAQNEKKIKEHESKVAEDPEATKQKINEWRKGQKN